MSVGHFAFGDETWPGIAKLAEECGEVVQVIGKLMMTHGEPTHWSGDLRSMLVAEMGDLSAALLFVKDNCLSLDEADALSDRTFEKLERFAAWRDEQRAEKAA